LARSAFLRAPSSSDSELAYPVRDLTRQSHFVLHDGGAFVLQYPPNRYGDGTFRGEYRDTNGVIMFLFQFQGRSVDDARDDATGTLRGNSLAVEYDETMQHADFENAVYLMMR
jgi:hypothetical protein